MNNNDNLSDNFYDDVDSLLALQLLEYKPNPYYKLPKYKKYKVNEFLSNFDKSASMDYIQYGIDFFNIYNQEYINIMDYKKGKINNYTYKIIKDTITNTWFFTCKNILILYINKRDYEEFSLLNQYSPYCFYVYKNESPYYTIICVSHTLSEIKNYLNQNNKDILSFYIDNLALIKYIILSEYINSFIILNTKYQINPDKSTRTTTFTLYNIIGSNNTNTSILQILEVIKHIYKIFNNNYPKHFLELS